MPKISKAKPEAPSGLTLPEYAKLQKKLDAKRTKAQSVVDECKSLIYQIAVKHIPPLMEKLEQEAFDFDGGRIELRQEVHPSFTQANQAAFYQWLRKTGNGSLIKETVNPKTLKAFAEEQLEANKPLPESLTVAIIPTAKLLGPSKKRTRNK